MLKVTLDWLVYVYSSFFNILFLILRIQNMFLCKKNWFKVPKESWYEAHQFCNKYKKSCELFLYLPRAEFATDIWTYETIAIVASHCLVNDDSCVMFI